MKKSLHFSSANSSFLSFSFSHIISHYLFFTTNLPQSTFSLKTTTRTSSSTMNRERDMQQQQEQDWDKPANRAARDQNSKTQSSQSKAQAQSMSSDLRELPVDAATPSAVGMKECACVGACDCATNDAIRASEEHIPRN